MSEEKEKKSIWLNDWLVLLALVAMCVSAPILLLVLKSGWALLGILDAEEQLPAEAVRGVSLLFTALIGGVAAVIFGTWRAVIASAQTKVARNQYERSLDRDYADLFTKAVEQLGTDKVVKRQAKDAEDKPLFQEDGRLLVQEVTEPNIEVRLGAIYALSKIALQSKEDHIPIMKTLCAYIRENAPADKSHDFEPPPRKAGDDYWKRAYPSSLNEWLKTIDLPREDVQAALSAIGQRENKHILHQIDPANGEPFYRLDLRMTNLCWADLSKGDFQNARMDNARLVNAILKDTNFQNADFRNTLLQRAIMRNSIFDNAFLSFAKLQFCQIKKTSFKGAKILYSKMQCAYIDNLDLDHTIIRGTDFESANMIEIKMNGANASLANFKGANSLSQRKIEKFFGCAGTSLPDALVRPQHWHPASLNNLQNQFEAFEQWTAARAAGEKPPWVAEGDWAGWSDS